MKNGPRMREKERNLQKVCSAPKQYARLVVYIKYIKIHLKCVCVWDVTEIGTPYHLQYTSVRANSPYCIAAFRVCSFSYWILWFFTMMKLGSKPSITHMKSANNQPKSPIDTTKIVQSNLN